MNTAKPVHRKIHGNHGYWSFAFAFLFDEWWENGSSFTVRQGEGYLLA